MRSVRIRSTEPGHYTRASLPPPTEQPEQNTHVPSPSVCVDLHTLIAKRAYEFYGERGYWDGAALDDWLAAEREILGRNPPA